MGKTERLRDDLSAALQQSAKADAVWRRAMAHDTRPEHARGTGSGSDQVLARLWQDRERAREGVVELRRELRDRPPAVMQAWRNWWAGL